MKKIFFLILITSVIVSCKTKQAEKIATGDTTHVTVKTDTGDIKADSHYFWSSELDQKNGLVMKKTIPISDDSLSAVNIIRMLNDQYPEIRVEFTGVSNDSIFVKIRKSGFLTQQMGSSGADAYLAEVTYNLTELKDINYVDIRFKEGDHASPGVYSRTDFVRTRN